MSDYMVALNPNGSLRSAGAIEDGEIPDEETEQAAKEDIKETKEQISSDEPKVEDKKPATALVKEEEKSEGRISKKAMFNFFKYVLPRPVLEGKFDISGNSVALSFGSPTLGSSLALSS